MNCVKQRVEMALIHGYIDLHNKKDRLSNERMPLNLNREDYIVGIPPHIAFKHPDSKFYENIPNYVFDLNAVRQVEDRLIKIHKFEEYVNMLNIIVIRDASINYPDSPHMKNLIHASSEQKCEAILRVMDLWVE